MITIIWIWGQKITIIFSLNSLHIHEAK